MQRLTKILSSKNVKMSQKNVNATCVEIKRKLTIEDMPHPKSLPIVGTKIDLMLSGSGKQLHEYVDRRHKSLGPIFYEQLGGNKKIVFISEPSLMKDLFLNVEGKYPIHLLPDPWILYEKLYGNKRGLFFMNGEEWLTNRRVMNKHLLRDDTEKWMERVVKETVDTFIQKWTTKAKHGSFTPNLESDFYRFSTDVIISILLGSNSTLKSNHHSEFLLSMFSESVKKIFQTTTKLYGLPVEWCQYFNLKSWRNFKESVDMSLSLAQKIVAEIIHNKDDSNGLIKRLQNENMDKETITRIVADFVIAAGDTTAYTSLWILYILSNEQDFLKELRTNDVLYVKYVIKEAMRLYPVAPFLTRILPKASVLDIYNLNEGVSVL